MLSAVEVVEGFDIPSVIASEAKNLFSPVTCDRGPLGSVLFYTDVFNF